MPRKVLQLLFLLICVFYPVFALAQSGQPQVSSSRIVTAATINWDGDPIQLEEGVGGVGGNGNLYAPVRIASSPFAQPDLPATYRLALANYDIHPYTYQLENTLPEGLEYIPGSASEGLVYDDQTRKFTWTGTVEPAYLEYEVTPFVDSLPYVDLANYGVENLCDVFVANGESCDDVWVTVNLGVNNQSAMLYGEGLSEVVISSNGIALVSDTPTNFPESPYNQWLPSSSGPNHLLAGFWRDSDMTTSGRWHVAIIANWIDGHDVLYIQWHNAPHKANPDYTVRHAIAIILNGTESSFGDVYYIYDNISDPQTAIALGYTIGLEDKYGNRGTTWAYAPCCGNPQPPQGYPPSPGTTLKVHPILYWGDNNYRVDMSYQVTVTGQVPEMIVNTVYMTSDSPDPMVSYTWDTHYLFVRNLYWFPLLLADEQQ